MNSYSTSTPRVYKYQSIIEKLAPIAFICAIVTLIGSFLTYEADYSNYQLEFKLAFAFPEFKYLLSIAVAFAPYLFFHLFNKKSGTFKASQLMQLVYFFLAAGPVLTLIINSTNEYSDISLTFELLLSLAFAAACVMAALMGSTNRILFVIAPALGLVSQLISLADLFDLLDYCMAEEFYLYAVTYLAGLVASIALLVALLLDGLQNLNAVPQNNPELSIEMQLAQLNEQLSLGLITPEEFLARQEEILNRRY